FTPCDELKAYRRGEEWDPRQAEEQRRMKEAAQWQAEEEALHRQAKVTPLSNYKDKYSHLIGWVAAKDATQAMEANKAYSCAECGKGDGGRREGGGELPDPPPS
ncbi:putative Sperm-associated antigen 7-like protein, partial [Naja naja]